MDQRNRLEKLEINPCLCGQLIFDKDDKKGEWWLLRAAGRRSWGSII